MNFFRRFDGGKDRDDFVESDHLYDFASDRRVPADDKPLCTIEKEFVGIKERLEQRGQSDEIGWESTSHGTIISRWLPAGIAPPGSTEPPPVSVITGMFPFTSLYYANAPVYCQVRTPVRWAYILLCLRTLPHRL